MNTNTISEIRNFAVEDAANDLILATGKLYRAAQGTTGERAARIAYEAALRDPNARW